jgi:hypothetical protein
LNGLIWVTIGCRAVLGRSLAGKAGKRECDDGNASADPHVDPPMTPDNLLNLASICEEDGAGSRQ